MRNMPHARPAGGGVSVCDNCFQPGHLASGCPMEPTPRVRLDGARQARLPEQEQVVRPLREGGLSEGQVPPGGGAGRQLDGFRRRQWRRLVLDMGGTTRGECLERRLQAGAEARFVDQATATVLLSAQWAAAAVGEKPVIPPAAAIWQRSAPIQCSATAVAYPHSGAGLHKAQQPVRPLRKGRPPQDEVPPDQLLSIRSVSTWRGDTAHECP